MVLLPRRVLNGKVGRRRSISPETTVIFSKPLLTSQNSHLSAPPPLDRAERHSTVPVHSALDPSAFLQARTQTHQQRGPRCVVHQDPVPAEDKGFVSARNGEATRHKGVVRVEPRLLRAGGKRPCVRQLPSETGRTILVEKYGHCSTLNADHA